MEHDQFLVLAQARHNTSNDTILPQSGSRPYLSLHHQTDLYPCQIADIPAQRHPGMRHSPVYGIQGFLVSEHRAHVMFELNNL